MQRIEKKIADISALESALELGPQASVEEAVGKMLQHRASCVLITMGGRVCGIFTERDFLNRVAGAGRSSADTRLEEVMTPDPECLGAEHSVAYAINCMVTEGFRNVPVVDANGRLAGVLTARGVIEHLVEIFEEAEAAAADPALDEWVDEGGGA